MVLNEKSLRFPETKELNTLKNRWFLFWVSIRVEIRTTVKIRTINSK